MLEDHGTKDDDSERENGCKIFNCFRLINIKSNSGLCWEEQSENKGKQTIYVRVREW